MRREAGRCADWRRDVGRAVTHCQGCRCDEYREKPAQPSTASRWAIEAAKKAAADAVFKAKEARKKPTEETE